jgi:AraC-like DNA-binding protein
MSSFFQFFTLLNLALSVVFLVLLIFVFIKVKNNIISNAILVALIVSRIFSQMMITLYANGSFLTQWPLFYRSVYAFEFSCPVLVYLYIFSLIKRDFQLKHIRWFHGVPFLLGLSWYFFGPRQFDFAMDRYLRTLISFFITIPYMWGAQKLISDFKAQAENQIADLSEMHFPWIRFLVRIGFISMLLNFLDVLTGPSVYLWIYSGVITNFALIGLIYFGLKTSDFFKKIETETESDAISDTEIENREDEQGNEELALQGALLLKQLSEGDLYLRPQIRLADIAAEMGLKSYKLTEIINRGLKTNFYDLINGLRVERAMNLMRDPSKNHLNLLGIAMESGFNSKSVFNDQFRRLTGMTPSEYRQQESMNDKPANSDV